MGKNIYKFLMGCRHRKLNDVFGYVKKKNGALWRKYLNEFKCFQFSSSGSSNSEFLKFFYQV